MARFTDPDEARAYLASLSDHPDRPGDTSRLHPRYAVAMANAIADARAAGMPVRLLSGQREGNVTKSKYDMGGFSSHTYGLAADVEGIGKAGSDTASKWRQIAQANGLSSPYNPNGSEWNHWQFGPKLEDAPELRARLQKAHASGDDAAMWNAFTPTTMVASSGNTAVPTSTSTSSSGGSGGFLAHEQFIRDYARKIGIDPDQAVAIARAEGMNSTGFRTPNQASTVDVSGGQPFSFGDFQLNTRNGMGADALKAGIDPRDPNQWQQADMYALDRMRKEGVGAWSNPVARGIAAHGGLTLNTPQPGAISPPHTLTPSTAGAPYTPEAVAAANPAPAAPAAPNFGESIAKGDVGGAIKAAITAPKTKDAQGNEVQGQSPLEKIAGAFGGDGGQKQAPQIPEMTQSAPVQDPMMGITPAAQQLFQTVQASAAKPLTWSARPYGSNAGFQGTTLNQTGYGYNG